MEKENTNRVVKAEREDQTNIINLLCEEHGYKYIGNLSDKDNSNIIDEELKAFLESSGKYSDYQISQAINRLKEECRKCTGAENLKQTNEEVYSLLRNGTSVYNQQTGKNDTINFIDWKNYTNNKFLIAEEVKVNKPTARGESRRPDVVLYINGIALVVLELKKASNSVNDGISQNIRNQGQGEIPHFFTTIQLIMAGNRSQGLWYGVIGTPEKFYVRWKEPVGEPCPKERYSEYKNELDKSSLQMLEPTTLVDFIYNFIIFDGGVKKTARPSQYFAILQARERIKQKRSGIIWHSQGSGKSLIMIWLAKWIQENITGSRIVVITDRDELDRQITQGFYKANEEPFRATSSNEMIEALNNYSPTIICTLVHKFGRGNSDEEGYSIDGRKSRVMMDKKLEEVVNSLPQGFSPKGNIFAFVDECHRTQGGLFNLAMKKILGENTMFIGFTGTPLLKEDKEKLKFSSTSNFGPYIHTYKFKEAVDDKVILDLRYEPKQVEQNITDRDALDKMFDKYTERLNDKAKEKLKDLWIKNENLYSSEDRMKRIVFDICQYMNLNAMPLVKGYGNAMLVAENVYQAYRYWKIFQGTELEGKCAVISSYEPIEVPLNKGFSGGPQISEEEFKYSTAKEMLNGKSLNDFESEVKEKFITEPENMKLLIVVDKLLTGFDAPCATYMFIDKHMENHTLFQAICRVNRVNGPLKDYGYIVDYKDLFNCIKEAINDYSAGAFKEYEKTDIEGLLKTNFTEAKKDLDNAIEKIESLCEHIKEPKSLDNYFDYFVYSPDTPIEEQQAKTIENTSKREKFYNACRTLIIKYLTIDTRMQEAGYTKEQAQNIHKKVLDYNDIQKAIMLRSGDITDLKQYSASMRNLMDRYVQADTPRLVAELDDFSFLEIVDLDSETKKAEKEAGGIRGVAETLEANARKVINQKRETNPEAYSRFSEQLNKLLEENKAGHLEYEELIKKIIELCRQMKNREELYPKNIDSPLKRALYDNMNQNEETVLQLYEEIQNNAQKNWDTAPLRRSAVEKIVTKYCNDDEQKTNELMRILVSHKKETPC